MKEHSLEHIEKNQGTALRGRHALTEEGMIREFKKDPVEVWVNSFGGCRSNWIENALRKKYNTRAPFYDFKGCHYIRPIDVPVDLGIFCYVEDVGIALSCIDNKLATAWHVFEKLVPPKEYNNMNYDIGHWLDLISKQIDYWSNNPYFPTMILNTDKMEDTDLCNIFERIMDVEGELNPFRNRVTQGRAEWLAPYEKKINQVNRKLAKLPNFEINIPEHALRKSLL